MLLITQPNYDFTTQWISSWSNKIADLAKTKGLKVIILNGLRANRKEFESVIAKIKPKLVFFNGHGSHDQIAGHNHEPLVQVGDNSSCLKGKIIYALSCLSAKTLGPDSIRSGALAYVGYIEDFMFYLDKSKISNPQHDDIAGLFLEPSNTVIRSLIKGHDVQFAWESSQEEFKRNIRNLLAKGDRIEINTYLPPLLWDMKNQVALGDQRAKI